MLCRLAMNGCMYALFAFTLFLFVHLMVPEGPQGISACEAILYGNFVAECLWNLVNFNCSHQQKT